MGLKLLTLITSFIFIIQTNDTSAQSIKLSAKVVIKKNEQYLKVTLKSRKRINMQLRNLGPAFLIESLEPKVYFYDSLDINYQDKFKDTLSPSDYYDIDPPILFFSYKGKYIRYFYHDLNSFMEENKERMWVFESVHMWEMLETYKRRVIKIPLSINPEILKLKPKRIIFRANVSYGNLNKSIESTDIKVEGKVRYCIG